MAPGQKIAVRRSPLFQLIFQHLAEITVSRLDNKSFKNDSVIFVINQVENIFRNLGFIGKMCLAINAEAGILWVSKIGGFPAEKAPLLKKGDLCLPRSYRLSCNFVDNFGKNTADDISRISWLLWWRLCTYIANLRLDNAASFNLSFFVRKKAMVVECTAAFTGTTDASGENGGC